MPVVQIWMHKGRTKEQKDALIREITSALERTCNAKPESTNVIVVDVEKSDWGVNGKSCG